MWAYKVPLGPDDSHRKSMEFIRDQTRQLYNHTRYLYTTAPDGEKPTYTDVQNRLPEWKRNGFWPALNDVHSKVLQMAVRRFFTNLSNLRKQKEAGWSVGMLRWKPPREYRSFTYNQTGFKFKNKSGQHVLWLSGIGNIPVRHYRDIPEDATIKQVTVKKNPTGDWTASFNIEYPDGYFPEKPALDNLDELDVVGIDCGIMKQTHDTDGLKLKPLDLTDEYDRLEREQRSLSRKQHGSSNYEKQRRRVAEVHEEIVAKREDYLRKLAYYYTTQFDVVSVEDLNVSGMMESPRNTRRMSSVSWRKFLTFLDHAAEKHACHVVQVDPRGTTKECASCGVDSEKPLWVREHSCPACGYTADRDFNAAANILYEGLEELGVVHSEGTPVETATAASTVSGRESVAVDASRVVEAGSRVLKETVSTVE